jgi:hypothetical protein
MSGRAIARPCEVNWAVVVTIIAVGMVQVAVDEIVDVGPQRYCFIPVARSVNVAWLVATAATHALVQIFGAHHELVLVYMITVRMLRDSLATHWRALVAQPHPARNLYSEPIRYTMQP